MVLAKVIKKNDAIEDFDINKIKSSVIKAGMSEARAEKLAAEIEKWASEKGSVKSSEIEEKIIYLIKDTQKDVLIRFLLYTKTKVKPITNVFSKKDIAQMLTSFFIIIQTLVYITNAVPITRGLLVLFVSVLTCSLILYLSVGNKMWKHLISGIIVVTFLSLLTGEIINTSLNNIIIAIAAGLPVAAMVDILKVN